MNRALVTSFVAALALAGAASGSGVPHWSHWLCFPGSPSDWCSVELTTDVFTASGGHSVVHVSVPANPPVDCFYVYPTVSEEYRGNSDLVVRPEERETAITQAARFSHVCRVYAPMYRQVTVYGNGNPFHGRYADEYDDVLAAWKDYLAHDNHGRGVVLVGHSEGAFLLERLIRQQIEPSAAERKLFVSAVLLGGNVVVADRRLTGGSFRRVPACTSSTETGCVVAYSSWGHTPPSGALFQDASASDHVLCVNPAAPGSTAAVPVTPIFAGLNPQGIAPGTSRYVAYHWVEFPGLYAARCVFSGKRAWLLVTRVGHPGDRRPSVQQALGPNWGFHAADVNITLANLVSLVGMQARAWTARH